MAPVIVPRSVCAKTATTERHKKQMITTNRRIGSILQLTARQSRWGRGKKPQKAQKAQRNSFSFACASCAFCGSFPLGPDRSLELCSQILLCEYTRFL